MKEKMLFRKKIFTLKTAPYILILPALAMIIIFMFYPILKIFFNSFHNYVLTRPKDYGFNGLDNYIDLFKDPLFYKGLKNSLVWTFFNVIVQSMIGLLIALIMNVKFKGRKFFRMIVFSPWAFGGMLVALMFGYMFNGQTGVINDLLLKAGIINQRIAWFSSPGLSMFTLIFTATWRGIPFFAVSFLAALQSIPHDYYEAADVDGAGTMFQFTHITLPLIKNTIILTTMLRTIWIFKMVDIIAGMTNGGPNNSTMTLPLYLMTTFNERMDIGYSSATAGIMSVMMAAFAGLYAIASGVGKENDVI